MNWLLVIDFYIIGPSYFYMAKITNFHTQSPFPWIFKATTLCHGNRAT